MLEATKIEGEDVCFNINIAFSGVKKIPIDSLLKWSGVSNYSQITKEQFLSRGRLKYVYGGELMVESQPMSDINNVLYLDETGQKTQQEESAIVISTNGDYGIYTLQFAACTTAVKGPIQFVLNYTYNNEQHDVLFTANTTIDRMIYPYEIEKGTVKYELKNQKSYSVQEFQTDTFYYSFNNYGWDNFEGVVLDNQNPEGRYNWIFRSNNKSGEMPDGVDGKSGIWGQYNSGEGWTSHSGGESLYPYFSLAGVNDMHQSYYAPWYGRSYLGLACAQEPYNNYDYPASVATTTIKIGQRDITVEKYEFVMRDDSSNTVKRIFYVYKGIVLRIDSQETNTNLPPTTILSCVEFKEGEADPSFHRWLKNNGVTDYNGMVTESDYPEIDGQGYVDLDLPSGNLWAANNVGAPSPYDWGDYLAWGETTEKENYSYGNPNPQALVDKLLPVGFVWHNPALAISP